ncbi:MAG: trypsin-like peptidase domain-containing protein, partial [Dehalococcoidia bacterium]
MLLFDDDGGETAAPAASDATPAGPGLTVEQTSAVIEVAVAARPSVVRIESTRRDEDGALVTDVGSGVIVDEDGHIMTNAHVVLGTETLLVILPDGSERPGILLGHDAPFTDVAVLQVGPGDLTPIPVGSSGALSLGETVVVIGNPLSEFEGSVTVGVVSGLNRVRTIDSVAHAGLIQTDAAINAGNSGGALLNLQGQFVGMPTSVIRESRDGRVVEGIAFAVPSDQLMPIVAAIIANGENYPRPSLELEHIDLSPETAEQFRIAVDDGALVLSTTPGGVAAQAGILAGDIITAVSGAPVDRSTPLLNVIAGLPPGDR